MLQERLSDSAEGEYKASLPHNMQSVMQHSGSQSILLQKNAGAKSRRKKRIRGSSASKAHLQRLAGHIQEAVEAPDARALDISGIARRINVNNRIDFDSAASVEEVKTSPARVVHKHIAKLDT